MSIDSGSLFEKRHRNVKTVPKRMPPQDTSVGVGSNTVRTHQKAEATCLYRA